MSTITSLCVLRIHRLSGWGHVYQFVVPVGGRRCDIKGHFTGRTFLAEVGASLSEQRGEILMVSKAEFDETPD